MPAGWFHFVVTCEHVRSADQPAKQPAKQLADRADPRAPALSEPLRVVTSDHLATCRGAYRHVISTRSPEQPSSLTARRPCSPPIHSPQEARERTRKITPQASDRMSPVISLSYDSVGRTRRSDRGNDPPGSSAGGARFRASLPSLLGTVNKSKIRTLQRARSASEGLVPSPPTPRQPPLPRQRIDRVPEHRRLLEPGHDLPERLAAPVVVPRVEL